MAWEYDPEIGEAICTRLSGGETMREIERDPDMPSHQVVYRWLGTSAIFKTAFARARVAQMERWAEEIIEIADDASGDWVDREAKDGTIQRVVDHETVQRARLRIDTRRWVMSKLSPTYADRVDVQIGGTMKVENMSDAELEDRTRARLLALGVEVGTTPLLLGTARPAAQEPEPELEGDDPESDE